MPNIICRYWPVLVLTAGCVVLALNLGIRQSLGILIPDMMTATGWSAGVFGLAFAIQNLIWGMASPVAGILADRYGTAKTLIAGTGLYGAGLILMGMSASPWGLHGSAGLILGIGVGATTFPIVLGAIGRAFPPEKRSLALGIASAGGSVGQAVMAPATDILNGALGFETALIYLAAIALIMAPLGLMLSGKAASGGSGQHMSGPQTVMGALQEAFGERSYVLLTLGFFVCGFHVALIATFLPAYVQLCGLPVSVAAQGLLLIGVFNIFGTLAAGWFGGRFPKKWGLSAIYAARAVVMSGFLFVPKTEASFLIFSAFMGFLWLSTVPLTSGIVAQVFGPRYMASLFGVVMLSHQVGAFLGAWMGGVFYDLTGGFDLVWMIAAGLGVFAALVNMPIKDVGVC